MSLQVSFLSSRWISVCTMNAGLLVNTEVYYDWDWGGEGKLASRADTPLNITLSTVSLCTCYWTDVERFMRPNCSKWSRFSLALIIKNKCHVLYECSLSVKAYILPIISDSSRGLLSQLGMDHTFSQVDKRYYVCPNTVTTNETK